MHNWIEFWFIFFWISLLSFLFNYSNFLFFFFFTELMWLILFILVSIISAHSDDLNTLGFTFFFLGLAGLEFSIGFVLLIVLKAFKISLNINKNDKTSNFYNKNYKSFFFLDSCFWIK